MTDENVEIVRESFQALAEGGVDALLLHIDDDFEVTTPSALAAEPDTYRGHGGVRRWFDSFYEVMDEVRIEPNGDLVPAGEKVIVPFRLTARGRSTQLEFSQEAVGLWEARDGKAVGMELFQTVEEAQAAASNR